MAEVRSLSKPDAMTIRLLWKSSTTPRHPTGESLALTNGGLGKAKFVACYLLAKEDQVDQDDSAEAHRALPAKFHEKSGRECPIPIASPVIMIESKTPSIG